MSAQSKAAALRLQSVGDDIGSGLSKGFVLVSLDTTGSPEYTIYTHGDETLRLLFVGALHEAITILLNAEQSQNVAAPASSVLN